MNVELEQDPDLTTAHALFALLEAGCLTVGEAEMLPYLGMARTELVEDGVPTPAPISQLPLGSFGDGLEQLDGLLTRLIQLSDRLDHTLRLTHARDLLREGMESRGRRL